MPVEKHRFTLNKLVRDLIPSIMRFENEITPFLISVDTKEELIKLLKDKLLEETKEVIEAKLIKQFTEELADLLEVFEALSKTCGVSLEQIEEKRLSKKRKFGGFDKATFITHVEIWSDNDEWIKHFRKEPDRYPEEVLK